MRDNRSLPMKLVILSCSPKCYSTRRLVAAGQQRGHSIEVLNTLKFTIDLQPGTPDLYYRGQRLVQWDAVLPRIGASVSYFGTAVVRQFEQMDVYCANSSNGITNARDKLRALQILSRHQIGIPPTTFVRDRLDILPAIERVGGAPVIIKLLEGTQGVGVILAETVKVAEAIIETLHRTRQNVLLQKFVSESRGRDIRAVVVGDEVVAAMRRVAQGDEFRSNVHRGGRAERVVLDDAYRQSAVRAAQIMGLRIAGVDMLEGRHGPLIMEVNSSPGTGGHRECNPARHRRSDHRLYRRPGGFSGIGRTPAADRQPRIRGRRVVDSRRLRLYRKDDSRSWLARKGHQRLDPASRDNGHPQSQIEPRAGRRRSTALLRQTRFHARTDSRSDQGIAPPHAPRTGMKKSVGCRL